jgi:hypothetical protein
MHFDVKYTLILLDGQVELGSPYLFISQRHMGSTLIFIPSASSSHS